MINDRVNTVTLNVNFNSGKKQKKNLKHLLIFTTSQVFYLRFSKGR